MRACWLAWRAAGAYNAAMSASAYSDYLAASILVAVESGLSVRKACEQAGIAKSTFLGWVDARPMLLVAYHLATKGRNDRRRAEIAELSKEIDRLEASIPKERKMGEPRFIFRSRRRCARKAVLPKITALRLRRDVLKWELGRMTAHAR